MQLPHRFIAVLLLLAYACTGTAIMPVVAMALAAVEGSHEVKIRHSAQGTQVLLHHAGSDYTPEVSDHASSLARLLVRMCRPDAEGDHSLCLREAAACFFNSTDEVKRELKTLASLKVGQSLWLTARALGIARQEPGRAAWWKVPSGHSQQSHRLVETTHLLI